MTVCNRRLTVRYQADGYAVHRSGDVDQIVGSYLIRVHSDTRAPDAHCMRPGGRCHFEMVTIA